MRAAKSQCSGRSPRLKAGRLPKPKRSITFRLTVEAQEMIVSYKPDLSKSEYASGRFEFRSPRKGKHRILISETGYLCHFAPMDDVKAASGPRNYARLLVLGILDGGPKNPAHIAREHGQLSLFA